MIHYNNERKRELTKLATYAENYLNRVIFPICKEIEFSINTEDKNALLRYIHNANQLKADFVALCKQEAGSKVLGLAVEEGANKLFNDAYMKHYENFKNTSLLTEITEEAMGYVVITGDGMEEDLMAVVDSAAIMTSCEMKLSADEVEKREEIKNLCETLNDVFNGEGQLFMYYIRLNEGKFSPIEQPTYTKLLGGQDNE